MVLFAYAAALAAPSYRVKSLWPVWRLPSCVLVMVLIVAVGSAVDGMGR